MDVGCSKIQINSHLTLYYCLFSFPFFSLLLNCPHSLHASPSSQRIYKGEKDLKGLGEKTQLFIDFIIGLVQEK